MSEAISLIDQYIEEGQVIKTLKDYERNKQQLLFRRIINDISGSKNSIEGFNNWATILLPKQFSNEKFISKDGVEISFTDIMLSKPMYVLKGKEEILYPNYARKYKIQYTGRLTGTCIAKKGKEIIKTKIYFGDIPIMLGSVKCNLFGKTSKELVKLGECVSDPFGYFILNSERSVISHDKLRSNYPFISKWKKTDLTPEVRETYNVKYRTRLVISKKINAIKLVDERNRTAKDIKHIPVFVVFKIISGLEPQEIIQKYLFRFIPEEDREAVQYALSESEFKYNKHPDVYMYLYKKRLQIYKDKYNNRLSKQEIKNIVIEDLESDIYSNYNYIKEKKTRIEAKIISLCFLLSKLVLFMIGKVNLDHKDHWKAKRFENAPVLLSSLVLAIFRESIRKIRKEKDSKNSDYMTFGELFNSKCTNFFKKYIENSFNTANWGINTTGWQIENHAEATKRDTPLALWSQNLKNTNNTSTDGQVVELRFLQPSQRNRHCMAETPEGKQVGIVKYNCLTGLFSIESDPKNIIELTDKYGAMYSESYNIAIIINGTVVFSKEKNTFLYVKQEFKDILIENKRAGNIPLDTEIVYNRLQNVIQIFTDSSRPICPYLIVNPKTRKLVIDEKNGWKAGFQKLITSGCMEFLSASEEDTNEVIISKSVDHFYKTQKMVEEDKSLKNIYTYSHCCVDPLQIYSVSTSTCPLSNHQPSPRTTYQAAMGKQAVGYYNINYHLKFPREFKRLYKAERSITETDTYFLPKMDYMPSGQTANVAIMSTNDNQEDAIVVCEDYINSGNLNIIKYKTFEVIINTSSRAGGINHFRKPDLKPNDDPWIYRHLEENGLPKLDSKIEVGDCILGRVIETPAGIKNESVKAELDMYGYVDRIEIVREGNGRSPIIKIKLRNKRPYIAGDKLALRYAQKGTIGKVVKREEMPRVISGPNKGMVPDILFNSIGLPKRQTVGLPIEGLVSKAALYHGQRIDVSAFRFNTQKEKERAQKVLIENGFNPDGTEEMETGDGKKLENDVYFVPLFEQALRHHVMDKIQFRNTGPRDFKTHQPQGGRARGSGLKVGEMEKDAFAAHGASAILEERMMKSSDEFKLIVCGNCGSVIDSKVCRICDDSQPGILLIPYVFKVFIHLLNAINMDIRLKTKKITKF